MDDKKGSDILIIGSGSGSKDDKGLMDDMLRKMSKHAPSSGGKSVVSVRSNTPYFGQDDKEELRSLGGGQDE